MKTLKDYVQYDDDHLITEAEAVEIVMGELAMTHAEAKEFLAAEAIEWL